MTSMSPRPRGFLDKIVSRLGFGGAAEDVGDGAPGPSGDAGPATSREIGSIAHRELNAIRRLLGEAPVDLEAGDDEFWFEVLLREHLDAAASEAPLGDAETFAGAVQEASRWNLRRFKLEHAGIAEDLARALQGGGPEDGPLADTAEELLSAMDDVRWHLDGRWLTTEFERDSGKELVDEIRAELASDVRRVWDGCVAVCERLLDRAADS